ncbi:MAG: polysulfide reductase NrfD [Cytophagales bacterium]|nr:polysulfide reductase NrfD [Cytophagales bacterium]
MSIFKQMITGGLKEASSGSRAYHIWMGSLTLIMLIGVFCYYVQLDKGLIVTGMSDRVSWGLYISNFTFLVGVAAAAVMLVLPAYIFQDMDFSKAVLIGEGLAVSALVMCLSFVIVDLGGPQDAWHMLTSSFNFPNSMLSWDVIVLNGYLFINITIPLYILAMRFQGKVPDKRIYIPGVMISVLWALGIHLVTAFLYQGLPARPYWNTALLGPRFLASAFAGGPALIIIVLSVIRNYSDYSIEDKTIRKIALIVTGAAQINLIMLFSEIFKEFYFPTHHAESAIYLFFGLKGHNALVPWLWTSVVLNVLATLMLSLHRTRNNFRLLYFACGLLFFAIWIEKGFGLIIPGFIPGPWGKIVEYTPTGIEIGVTLGIWALGCFLFTVLARVGIAIETGRLRSRST